jgi:hypothetical protein
MPAMKTYREAIFSGWFGPMGVGAVFLSIIAKEELETAYQGKELPISVHLINPIVLFIVFCSVLVHGTTIPLFKLGKRIRTRTLSITSQGSSQVLRLPKLQFGQQLSKRSDDDKRSRLSKDDGQTLTQLQRNTLYNTIQHPKANNDFTTIDMHRPDSDSDIAEEDFLPDDSSDTLNAHSNVQKSDESHNNSSISFENPQAIRFLEPVKPRSAVTESLSNSERNETSVTSLRNWLHRHKDKNEEEDGNARRSFFNKKKKEGEMSQRRTSETPSMLTETSTGIHPRVQVWDEDHKVIIEDAEGQEDEVVIDKDDNPDWRKQMKGQVKDLEEKIRSDE